MGVKAFIKEFQGSPLIDESHVWTMELCRNGARTAGAVENGHLSPNSFLLILGELDNLELFYYFGRFVT